MASKSESVKTEVKKEVKIVKKQVQTEKKVDDQNGDQYGNVDTELVVKLPTKKSAAKTETKVEVMTKTLPDGSVEEVTKTITKTTVDGKTEIRTKTETRIIPKEDAEEVEEVEEEEEEETGEDVVEESEENNKVENETHEQVNGQDDNIVKTNETSEITKSTTKKVTIVEDSAKTEEQDEEEVVEEEEEVEEAEPVTVVIKKSAASIPKEEIKAEVEEESVEAEEEEEDIVEEEEKAKKVEVAEKEVEEEEEEEIIEEEEQEKKEVEKEPPKQEEEEDDEEQCEEVEEIKETEEKQNEEVKEESVPEETVEEKQVENQVEQEPEKEKLEPEKDSDEITPANDIEKQEVTEEIKEEVKQEVKEEVREIPIEIRVPLREPSIPLDKVEEVEIKPIGEVITKSTTQNTQIITSTTDKPLGPISTQTEYNRIENIVTVNRTTKTLDSAYENITQQGIPTVKTYFAPHVDRISASPQPARPYQPVYPPEPATERRHSLLLERLSMERQMPSDLYQSTNNYQYNNQSYEQMSQYLQEPQSEVLTVSNVKPSTITNQQWYQQNKKENLIYNNVTPTSPIPPTPSWTQPKPQVQPQTQYQPQPQYQTQPQYQPQAQPQPQYQPTNQSVQDRTTSNTYQQSTYTTYTPKPTWSAPKAEPAPNVPSQQYSFLNKDTTDSYQSNTQQYSSSYVPPPWEQDSSYVVDTSNQPQNFYQPPPQTSTFTPASSQGWKPTPPKSKFSKSTPTAYIPPAPNQSFVKPVTAEDPHKLPGRKTYYSEYERRYISVPESTYIPSETKYQPQPDPSPQYYYDNNEPSETVEHQWRKELREFTEKTSQTQPTEAFVKPPWEEDSYGKVPTVTYTPTPTWSQTLRPRSWRERSFESEYVGAQEWPKTSTLGRGRPLSSYSKSLDSPIPERTRGVSVDRYNPNSYQAPVVAEHPPVQTHTVPTPAPHAGYHNPNVPAYHSRASAEPREQPSYQQPQRAYREPRASPFQSRSFKYLQWITGTDD